MRAVIMQPCYFPWLGYFDRIEKSDVFIIFDNAQFVHRTSILFQNRNKIRTSKGWQWITVPVKNGVNQLISDVKIDNSQKLQEKHGKAIQYNYGNARNFNKHKEWLENFYSKDWQLLGEMNTESMDFLLKELGIKTKVLMASEIEKEHLKASEHLIHLSQQLNATEYLSGPYGKEYLEKEKFEKAGIKVIFHEFEHPTYEQAFSGFEPNLSALDLILNHGDKSRRIMGWE